MKTLTRPTLVLAAILVAMAVACDESPTQPEPEPDPQVVQMTVLDDGSARFLHDFKAIHPGASCSPAVIKALPPCAGGGALVEYECAVAVDPR